MRKINVLEMEAGDGCTTMVIYLMPQSCMLKMVKNGKFYVMKKKGFYTVILQNTTIPVTVLY